MGTDDVPQVREKAILYSIASEFGLLTSTTVRKATAE